MHPPNGYITLAEAWPEWLSRRFPKTSVKILDQATYRPLSLVTRTMQIGSDIATGSPIVGWETPNARAIEHANNVEFVDHANYEIGTVENEFWNYFCNAGEYESTRFPALAKYRVKNPGVPILMHARDGKWLRAQAGQWQIIRSHLWKQTISEDLRRDDYGPMRWLVREIGDIPPCFAVNRLAFEAVLSDRLNFHELSEPEQEQVFEPRLGTRQEIVLPNPVSSTPAKQLKRRTKPEILSGLLKEDPTITDGTRGAAIEKLQRIARERGFIGARETISPSTYQRAVRLSR